MKQYKNHFLVILAIYFLIFLAMQYLHMSLLVKKKIPYPTFYFLQALLVPI